MIPHEGSLDRLENIAESFSNKDQVQDKDVLYTYGVIGCFIAKHTDIPTILLDHSASREHTFSSDFRQQCSDPTLSWAYNNRKVEILKRLESAFNQPDAIISESTFLQEKLEEYFDVSSTVIPSPIQRDDFYITENDDDYFVSAQRLIPLSRIDVQIRAFAELDETLIIAGDGKHSDFVSQYSSEYSNIEYRGYLDNDELRELLSGAHGFIHTTHKDEFPHAPREALACGTPVIASDSGGMPELVQDNGILHNNTKESLIRAVESFDSEDYCAKDLREYTTKYDVSNVLPQIQSVTEKVLDNE